MTLAAFFHDAVYDPQRRDNEEQSAALAERVLERAGLAAGARRRTVGDLVRATAAPRGDRPTPDRAVLLDADLAVLGSEPAAYQAYVTGVRAEYAHVDDEAWRPAAARCSRACSTGRRSTPRPPAGTAGRRGPAPTWPPSWRRWADVSERATRAADADRDQRERRRAAAVTADDRRRSEASRSARRPDEHGTPVYRCSAATCQGVGFVVDWTPWLSPPWRRCGHVPAEVARRTSRRSSSRASRPRPTS